MLACPLCKKKLVEEKKGYLICRQKRCKFFKYKFPINKRVPNLIPFGENLCIFKKEKKTKIYSNYGSKLRILDSYKRRSRSVLNKALKGENSNSIYNFNLLEKNLTKKSRVLIIGGGNICNGMNSFLKKCHKYSIEYHSIDVYLSRNITAVADAHYLPFLDNYFNIVIIQVVITIVKSTRQTRIFFLHQTFNTNVFQNIYKIFRDFWIIDSPVNIIGVESMTNLMTNQKVVNYFRCPVPGRKSQHTTVNIEGCSRNFFVLNDEVLSCETLCKSTFDFQVDGHRGLLLNSLYYGIKKGGHHSPLVTNKTVHHQRRVSDFSKLQRNLKTIAI